MKIVILDHFEPIGNSDILLLDVIVFVTVGFIVDTNLSHSIKFNNGTLSVCSK